MNRQRSPVLAAIFSFLAPGLGQLYNGQLFGAVYCLVLFCIIWFLVRHFMWTEPQYFLSSLIAWLGIYLFCAIHAVFTSSKLGSKYQLKTANHWLAYLGFFFVATLGFTLAGTSGPGEYKPFLFPSASMLPNLIPGDKVWSLSWPEMEPFRGEVWVFTLPTDPDTYKLLRIVGLPGDEIFYSKKGFSINRKTVLRTKITDQVDWTGIPEGAMYFRESTPYAIYSEQIDSKVFDVLINESSVKQMAQPVRVPAGHYFALGDNRNNAFDSRSWGLIPQDHLIGRVSVVYFSSNEFGIHWKRMGIVP